MSVARLDRAAFADALRKGKGRALAHVRAYGDAGVDDLLLNACLHDQSYDRQTGSRAGWMGEMLFTLREFRVYATPIVAALRAATATDDYGHQGHLVALLAGRGDAAAKQALYAKFAQPAFQEFWPLGAEIVAMDDIDGAIHVARALGARFAADPDFGVDWGVKDRIAEAGAVEAIRAAATGDPALQVFVEQVIDAADPDPHPPRPRLSLPDFLAAIDTPGRSKRGAAFSFARRATEAELGELSALLATEPSPSRQAAMLHAFRSKAPPGGADLLLRFARSSDPDVRDAAIFALRHFSDPAVAAFADEMLDRGSLEAIRLLAKNPLADQAARIGALLPGSADDRAIHEIGLDLLEIQAESGTSDLLDCLRWIYETTPCAFCRGSSVRALLKIDRLPQALREECRDDCYDQTRTAVAEAP